MIYILIIILALGAVIYLLARRLPELLPGHKNPSPEKTFDYFEEQTPAQPNFYKGADDTEVNRDSVLPARPGADFIEKADRLFADKKFVSAEKWYLEAATVDPKNPKIYSRLGVIYLETGEHVDAKDAFEAAIELDPGIASRHFNLAVAYEGLGDLKLALKSVKKAISLEPRNEKYHILERSLKDKMG